MTQKRDNVGSLFKSHFIQLAMKGNSSAMHGMTVSEHLAVIMHWSVLKVKY